MAKFSESSKNISFLKTDVIQASRKDASASFNITASSFLKGEIEFINSSLERAKIKAPGSLNSAKVSLEKDIRQLTSALDYLLQNANQANDKKSIHHILKVLSNINNSFQKVFTAARKLLVFEKRVELAAIKLEKWERQSENSKDLFDTAYLNSLAELNALRYPDAKGFLPYIDSTQLVRCMYSMDRRIYLYRLKTSRNIIRSTRKSNRRYRRKLWITCALSRGALFFLPILFGIIVWIILDALSLHTSASSLLSFIIAVLVMLLEKNLIDAPLERCLVRCVKKPLSSSFTNLFLGYFKISCRLRLFRVVHSKTPAD